MAAGRHARLRARLTFDLVLIAANSLLHLHVAGDLVSCQPVGAQAPGTRWTARLRRVHPSVRLLADADGVRRTRESLSFVDPDGGRVDGAWVKDGSYEVNDGGSLWPRFFTAIRYFRASGG